MKDIAKKYEKKHVIECHNVPDIDMNKQDGGLPHMAGVYTYQVRRSCRADGDYTYNHAPMLTGFNNRLLLSYIIIYFIDITLLSSTVLPLASILKSGYFILI